MILGQQAAREITTEGLGDTVKMNISLSDGTQAHIIKVLTETYKYPEKSIVRENFSNHWDSHFESGKKETPIPVKLYRNETGSYTLETSDVGLGLTEEEFYKYYLGIGESSKRNKPFLIGGMGLGCKSALSKVDSYEVICRKNGIENKFLVFKGEQYPETTKIYTKDTEMENGVVVKIPVDRYDYNDYKEAIKSQLCYFPTAHIQIEGDNFDYNNAKIFENELFIWSEIHSEREMHISFNNCNYPIDWKLLKISPIYVPVGIKIALDSGVKPEFNRESLEYSKETKQLILSKIKEVANWFVNRYNSEWKEYETFQEAYYEIYNDSKSIIVADELFKINDLLKYADVKPLELKIKGIELNTPTFYKDNAHYFLNEYECLVDYSDYKRIWRTKHVKTNRGISKILDGVKHIEVNKIPTGKIKRYLLEKYDSKLVFIKKVNTRRLGNIRNTTSNTNILNYSYILDFHKHDKSTWRGLIQEWQFVENQLKSQIIDESRVEETKTYQDWLIKDKEYQKANRISYGSTSNHKVLNKQKGEVTLGMVVAKEVGKGYKIDKQTFKIEEFHRIPKLTICFNEDQKDRAKDFYALLNGKFNICVIGKNEFNKIKDKHNFMTEKQWQDSKSFKRIMTSIKYDSIVNEFNNLFNRNDIEIIKELVTPLYNDVQILKDYVNKNNKRVNSQILDELLAVAEEHNLYDFEFSDVYNRVKEGIKKYEFINLIQQPNYWNEEGKKKVKTLIGQLLYHQKMYHNLHENIEIELKPIVIAIPEEEIILEEQLETI